MQLVKMRLYWIGLGTEANNWYPYRGGGYPEAQRRPCDDGGREWCDASVS